MSTKPEISEAIPVDLAKAALRKDSSNLLKKVAAGKTLTKSEREILAKASEDPGTAKVEVLPKRAASMKAAASMLKFPLAWISAAKSAGCLGFNAKGSVLLSPVKQWIDANLDKLMAHKEEKPLRDQKLIEEVRTKRNFNDREEGKLVKREWVKERFHRFAGEWAAICSKAEAEDPVRLAEVGSDIALLRSAYRVTLNNLTMALRDATHHFDE